MYLFARMVLGFGIIFCISKHALILHLYLSEMSVIIDEALPSRTALLHIELGRELTLTL